ncbi:MAG: pyridoxal-dependent decarboxylase, exosortase A system-associated, partial [Novosphingobium sp.]
MKPLGPIPSGYALIDGELAVAGRKASALVAEAGSTPLFVYSAQHIRRRVAELREALPARVALHYAVKANPFAPVLALMDGLVDGFDIASGGELALLAQAGVAAERISFAGPGKREAELTAAISAGATLNLESEGEADRALAIAARLGLTPRLAIRVNPDFDLKGSGMKMGGGAKPFGVDADRVGAMARAIITSGAEWRGLHIFAGSQALSADAIIEA